MEEEEDNDEEAKAKKTTMTPWEQHSAVISVPRFDYNAPSSHLRRSHSGFLITCTISYCGTFAVRESNNLEVADAKLTPKRRKVCPEELDQDGAIVPSVGI